MSLNPKIIEIGLRKGRYVETDLGLERKCSRCKEFWPFDLEFWSPSNQNNDGLQSWCKACRSEHRLERLGRAA